MDFGAGGGGTGVRVIGHWNPNSGCYTAQLGSNHINITGLGLRALVLSNTVNIWVIFGSLRPYFVAQTARYVALHDL